MKKLFSLLLCCCLLMSALAVSLEENVVSVTGKVTQIEKYGHALLDVSIADFLAAGFTLGDVVTVKAGSMKRLALFVAEKLSTHEHVLSTATHFVLKKYKLEGVIFEERKQDERLVVTP